MRRLFGTSTGSAYTPNEAGSACRAMSESRLDLTPLVLVAMLLVLDMSIAASAFPTMDEVDSLGIGEDSDSFEDAGQELSLIHI